MDGERFDQLTRAWATNVSRRRVLKALLGGAAAGALSLMRAPETVAQHANPSQCREAGARCGTHAQCCSGICDETTRTCAQPPCADVVCIPEMYPDPNQNCACVCIPQFEPCGSTCCDPEAGQFCKNAKKGICATA